MARVYLSSTVADLRQERQAVTDWLIAAGHQPVHSYRPDSESVRESCLRDIDSCDAYVLILGHRYGYEPEEENPENLSITHLEFRRAKQAGLPRVALLRSSVPDISLSDLLDPVRSRRVLDFHEEVRREVRGGEFQDEAGLIRFLSTGIQSALEKRSSSAGLDSQLLAFTTTIARTVQENSALRARVSELEQQLQAAVARVMKTGARSVTESLAAGDTRPAEALLSEKEQKAAGVDDPERQREAAELARHQGALAMSRDLRDALASFIRATEYEPDDMFSWLMIGEARRQLGDLNEATEAYERARDVARRRLVADPGDADVQRNLEISYDGLGHSLLARGDVAGALNAYWESFAITSMLAEREPDDLQRRRDLALAYGQVARALQTQGDMQRSAYCFRKAVQITEDIATRAPEDLDRQKDLAAFYACLADVSNTAGNDSEALETQQRVLAIYEALLEAEPGGNWQERIASSCTIIGGILAARKEAAGALENYRRAMAIAVTLVDPATFQPMIANLHLAIGDALRIQEDWRSAIAAYAEGVAFTETVAAQNPEDANWQLHIVLLCTRLDAIEQEQSVDDRRRHLSRARAILAQLREQQRLSPEWDMIEWIDDRLAALSGASDGAAA